MINIVPNERPLRTDAWRDLVSVGTDLRAPGVVHGSCAVWWLK